MKMSFGSLRTALRTAAIVSIAAVISPLHAIAPSERNARAAVGARSGAQTAAWRFVRNRQVATIRTRYAPVVYYAPARPRHVLVLAFGYPWDEASDATILSYAQANVRDWTAFAEQNHVLVVAPVLGGSDFADYRELTGRIIHPDTFVDAVIDGPVRRLMRGWDGKFCLHGHSAGGQFAARYAVAHPGRLECAILSAPSTYAMPTGAVAWPYGMAASHRRGQHPAPPRAAWIAAATSTPTRVIVGSLDTETRPAAAGQVGASRLARAHAWASGMRALAAGAGRVSQVRFEEVPGSAHEERKMAIAAMGMLERFYRGSAAW